MKTSEKVKMENQKLRFFKKGGTLEDWNELLQSGLLPHQMSWVDAKGHDDILSYAESVLGKGFVMEYECHDWDGRAQGKACLRFDHWSEVGRGFWLEIIWLQVTVTMSGTANIT